MEPIKSKYSMTDAYSGLVTIETEGKQYNCIVEVPTWVASATHVEYREEYDKLPPMGKDAVYHNPQYGRRQKIDDIPELKRVELDFAAMYNDVVCKVILERDNRRQRDVKVWKKSLEDIRRKSQLLAAVKNKRLIDFEDVEPQLFGNIRIMLKKQITYKDETTTLILMEHPSRHGVMELTAMLDHRDIGRKSTRIDNFIEKIEDAVFEWKKGIDIRLKYERKAATIDEIVKLELEGSVKVQYSERDYKYRNIDITADYDLDTAAVKHYQIRNMHYHNLTKEQLNKIIDILAESNPK